MKGDSQELFYIRWLGTNSLRWCVSWKMESESHSVMSDSLRPNGLYSPWNSPGQNTEVGSLSLLQGIFPPQGSNAGLTHCGWILYQLSHQGSPRILEWVVNPFSRDLPDPGIEPGSPALQADSLPAELPRNLNDKNESGISKSGKRPFQFTIVSDQYNDVSVIVSYLKAFCTDSLSQLSLGQE